jgi:predicted nuclease with TOPRIM domain
MVNRNDLDQLAESIAARNSQALAELKDHIIREMNKNNEQTNTNNEQTNKELSKLNKEVGGLRKMVEAKISDLEGRVEELEARPPESGVDQGDMMEAVLEEFQQIEFIDAFMASKLYQYLSF